MYIMKKQNIEKIAHTESDRAALLAKGYKDAIQESEKKTKKVEKTIESKQQKPVEATEPEQS